MDNDLRYPIGIVGLGVMGANLALNMESRGFGVAGLDLDPAKVESFLGSVSPRGRVTATARIEEFVNSLAAPRRILMLVPAGSGVDQVIQALLPFLQEGDILMDGGNSFFLDTERRARELSDKRIEYLGMGISGGEEGARHGPAIMAGGSSTAWESISGIFTAIAARAEDGQPCVAYMGPRGAGHYVKMVHNGIEYADMQLIAEVYDVLSRGLGLTSKDLEGVFARWNQGELRSYLMDITARILGRLDPETGIPLVELILDEAQQKGTGKWTSQNALDIGAPIPTINAALEGRIISSLRVERMRASSMLSTGKGQVEGRSAEFIHAAEKALFVGKIIAYAQGFSMLRMASTEYGYGLKLAEIARIWRAGCIIRARILDRIAEAFEHQNELANLLLDEHFRSRVLQYHQDLRRTVEVAIARNIPVPALYSALAYFDSYRSERLPANLIQAQRDFFGAHTYKRIDRDGVFHTRWQEGERS